MRHCVHRGIAVAQGPRPSSSSSAKGCATGWAGAGPPEGWRKRRRGMKPYVICHMNSSVDGRILGSRWRPSENRMAGLFERIHEKLGGGSWLIGRVTGSEYAKAQAYPSCTDQTYPRQPWFA